MHRLAHPALHDAARHLARRDIDPALADIDAAFGELEVRPSLLRLNARREALATARMTALPLATGPYGHLNSAVAGAFSLRPAHDHLVADPIVSSAPGGGTKAIAGEMRGFHA